MITSDSLSPSRSKRLETPRAKLDLGSQSRASLVDAYAGSTPAENLAYSKFFAVPPKAKAEPEPELSPAELMNQFYRETRRRGDESSVYRLYGSYSSPVLKGREIRLLVGDKDSLSAVKGRVAGATDSEILIEGEAGKKSYALDSIQAVGIKDYSVTSKKSFSRRAEEDGLLLPDSPEGKKLGLDSGFHANKHLGQNVRLLWADKSQGVYVTIAGAVGQSEGAQFELRGKDGEVREISSYNLKSYAIQSDSAGRFERFKQDATKDGFVVKGDRSYKDLFGTGFDWSELKGLEARHLRVEDGEFKETRGIVEETDSRYSAFFGLKQADGQLVELNCNHSLEFAVKPCNGVTYEGFLAEAEADGFLSAGSKEFRKEFDNAYHWDKLDGTQARVLNVKDNEYIVEEGVIQMTDGPHSAFFGVRQDDGNELALSCNEIVTLAARPKE